MCGQYHPETATEANDEECAEQKPVLPPVAAQSAQPEEPGESAARFFTSTVLGQNSCGGTRSLRFEAS